MSLKRVGFLSLFFALPCFAVGVPETFSVQAKNILIEKYRAPASDLKIELKQTHEIAERLPASAQITQVRLVEDRPSGVAVFEVSFDDRDSVFVSQPFEAWVSVPVATRRISPNSKLSREDYRIDQVNIATGTAREYRGVLASPHGNYEKMIAKNTIVEGQFITRTAIGHPPDVRRGEWVRVELISGMMRLSTPGVAQESAAIGETVSVLNPRTKKEISGIVRSGGIVEIRI